MTWVVVGGCSLWVVVIAAFLVLAWRAGDPEATWADDPPVEEHWVCGCPVGSLHVCAAAADGRLVEIAVIETFGIKREGQ